MNSDDWQQVATIYLQGIETESAMLPIRRIIMAIPTLDAFQAIGDPSSRKMVVLLWDESLTINGLASQFDMARPSVCKYIKILEMAEFISIKDIGGERYCLLKKEGFDELQEWLNHFENFGSSKLKKLENLLNSKLPN